MVFTPPYFELFLCRKKTPDLFQCLWRDDQIIRGSRVRCHGHVHLRQSMAICCYHAHSIRSELPENTVQDWPAFLCRHSKRGMRNQLLQISGLDPPALIKLDGRKSREFISGKAQELELRAPALERNSLLTDSSYTNWCRRELTCDLRQLFCRDRNCSWSLDLCSYFCADGYIEICS